MEVSLTPELEEFVTRKVKSGDYASPSDVICAGLELLKNQERAPLSFSTEAELKDMLNAGLKSAELGHTVDGKEAFERLRKKVFSNFFKG